MPTYGAGFRVYDNPEAKLKTYRHRMRRAQKDYDGHKDRIAENWERYRNSPRTSQVTQDGHRTTTPQGIGVIDAMFSSLTAVNVDVVVKNIGRGVREQAKLAEAGLREVWREQKVSGRKGPKAVKDALIADIGWVKVGYEYAEVEVERDRSADDVAADMDTIIEGALAEGREVPNPDQLAELVPTREQVVEVQRDRIVVDHVPTEQIRWDPSAKRYEDIRWMAQVTKLPVEEVRQHPAYREYVEQTFGRDGIRQLDELEADSTIANEGELGDESNHEDDDRVTVVEFHDMETGTICTYAEELEDIILDERPNPFAIHDDLEDKNPFVPVVVREDNENVRGIGDMTVIKPVLAELDEYNSNIATYVARTIPKLLGPADALTDNGKRALQSKEWGAYVELEQGTEGNALTPLEPPALPQEVFGIPEKLEAALHDSTGASELVRGLFPDRKRTATETNAVTTMSNARQAEKRNSLAGFYESIAKRILWLMQMMYDAERVSRILEMDGDVEWEWSNEDIVAELDLEIHLSPKEAHDEQTRRDNAMGWFQMLAALPMVNIDELVKWTLEESGFDMDTIRKLIKLPEEVQREQQEQLQLQAQQQAVAEGEAPDPSAIPGPMAGGELAAAANPGEIPEELPAEEEEAIPLE